MARGLYWQKFERRLPDDYEFVVRRLYASAFPEILRHVMEHGGNGPHEIGDGVFGCAFMVAADDPFIIQWVMWFYESIFMAIMTGPKGFFDQFNKPKNEPKAMGFW